MIKLGKLYEATRGGLDIILRYYPQAADVVGTKNKFRARMGEKTPSAVLTETRDKDGRTVWKVTDFGDDGHALSPIDIAMKEEGISVFYEAVLRLASIFDVRDELDRSVNKPDVSQRPARPDEKEGERVFSLAAEIPEAHLKVLGPKVRAEDAAALGWHLAEYVGYVKNREVTLKHSNANYPIFMRECIVDDGGEGGECVRFFKVYEPLNPDKGFRFSYTPQGVKPKQYINGLRELKEAYRRWNADEEAAWEREPMNEGRPYRGQKLEAAFICSGERDALCCRSMGCYPLWFNSETYRISDGEYKEIMKYVERLYNIPDIDSTGVKKGTELALRFLDIHTVWLPDWLKTYRDNRGKHRKDLRDWMELRQTRKDFNDLITMAMPARFWTEHLNQRTGKREFGIDASCLHHFLGLHGFSTLKEDSSDSAIFIKTDGFVVRRVRPRDVRDFVRQWAMDNFLPREVRNIILGSKKLADGALECLRPVDLDFTDCTPSTQLFFFPRQTVEVSASGIKEYQGNTFKNYVWEEDVIPHEFKPLGAMFEATSCIMPNGCEDWDIRILEKESSPLFGYVINSSRMHWRKELEENFADRSDTEQMEYAAGRGRFCIDGDGLTFEEIREQKQNLLAKLFAIGYMLHRYKNRSRAWATQLLDSKIGEDGVCNGRSGKSCLFQALAPLVKTVKLSGRDPKLMENKHVFEQVTRHTDMVFVDDCGRYLSMEMFYDIITSDLTVNPKNNRIYTIPFDESPKFAFTTNYIPIDLTHGSTEGRMLYMVYSDYYHVSTNENGYNESRSIRDDFGRELFTKDYPEHLWNADINFLLQCCRFYLELSGRGVKLQPPMAAIMQRKYKADMGENFEDWATLYFAPGSEHLDVMIMRHTLYEEYLRTIGSLGKNYTMNRFTKQLRAYCNYAEHIDCLNPPHLCNSAGRITRRLDGKMEEMIYVQSSLRAAQNAELKGLGV